MPTSFDNRVRVPADVFLSELRGESVILNVKSESCFGLNEVGTRMWNVMTTADSVQAAYDILKDEYEVEPEQLRQELSAILDRLLEHGLLVCER